MLKGEFLTSNKLNFLLLISCVSCKMQGTLNDYFQGESVENCKLFGGLLGIKAGHSC